MNISRFYQIFKPFYAILSTAPLVNIQNYSKGHTYALQNNFTNFPHICFGGVN